MRTWLKTDLAWAAGFIDGEGSFFIGRTTQGKWRYFSVQLKVTQCNKEPLEKLQGMFGGYIYPEKTVSRLTKRQGWKWMAVNRTAERTARLLLPYFIVKKRQAELLVEMARRKRIQGTRAFRGNEFQERIELVEKMKKLNRGEL